MKTAKIERKMIKIRIEEVRNLSVQGNRDLDTI